MKMLIWVAVIGLGLMWLARRSQNKKRASR